MDKYRKVSKPKDNIVKDDDEIRVTSTGSVSAYVSRANKVFNELEKPYVVITATGNALTKAVTAAEVIKRRFKGLHQITKVGSQEIVDEYEPLEEGLDKVTDTRSLPSVEIKLSKDPLDNSDCGYQPPIDEELVSDFDPEKLGRSRGRGRGRGRGKGRGKGGRGRGGGDSEDDSEGGSPPKGKGKGKGKKGKGKGKIEDSDSDGSPKGKGKKGKGKGKGDRSESSKGKGKDKGKGKSRDVEDDYYAPPQKGKGKGKGKDKSGKGDKGSQGYSRGGGWDDGWDYNPPARGQRSSGGKGGARQNTYDWDSYDSWDSGYNSRAQGKSKGRSQDWNY